MPTLIDISAQVGRTCYDHVAAALGDADIPILDGPQSQGDVRVRAADVTPSVTVRRGAVWAPIPASGVVVVAGQHDHVLAGADAIWTTDVADVHGLAVGVVDAPHGAFLWHAEHGATGLAPGRWVVRRQREQAEVQRLVAD